MAETQSIPGGASGQAKSGPPLLLVLIAVVSVASLGLSGMAFMTARNHGVAKDVPKAEGSSEKSEAGERERYDLGEFLVNLADPDPQAFVKANIVVEYEAAGKKGGGHGEKSGSPSWEAPVRDTIVSTLSQCRRADIRSATGKEKLKAQILERVNQEKDPSAPKFVAVYFTSLAMQ